MLPRDQAQQPREADATIPAAAAATSTAAADKSFPEAASATFALDGITALSDDTDVTVVTSADITRVDERNWLVVLVEVDYIADAGAPTLDDISAPYLIESGQTDSY